jgi:transketolase
MTEIHALLAYKAYCMRRWSIIMCAQAQSGHTTSCLSAADLVSVLFFYAMHYDPDNIHNLDNDRFILSKGHASALLYAAWAELGKITEAELLTYRQYGSVLEGHPTRRCPYVQAATGSLGIGLSIGLGHALNARMEERPYYTYVLLGDGELAEGSIWEAAQLGSYYKLNNIIGIVDCNRLGQTGETMVGPHAQMYAQRFSAFGWHTFVIDGHNIQEIMAALDTARTIPDKPIMIIANTIKGYGVAFAADKNNYHGKALEKEAALQQLAEKFPIEATYANEGRLILRQASSLRQGWELVEGSGASPLAPYTLGEQISTRKAYGQALTTLGATYQEVISLDAEVSNSTYAEIFEQKYPNRFIECFIAEQNMVGMGIGLDQCNKKPFISTFGAFITRAHDQIRMAAIGQSTIKLVGSHAGVSIGEDGPSQMALEDIALIAALPNSVVLYPCDAVSTHALVEQMIGYTDGISYLRTTRAVTPVIYTPGENFPIGGCKILRQSDRDVACIIAAGITLFESLKAYETLEKEGIAIAIIDLYCVKPVDTQTIIQVARASHNRIITVEDHYIQGGIGAALCGALINTSIHITNLAITELPQSGKSTDLLNAYGISAHHIIDAVMRALG